MVCSGFSYFTPLTITTMFKKFNEVLTGLLEFIKEFKMLAAEILEAIKEVKEGIKDLKGKQ
jgi:hypothetical protein